LLDQLGSMRTYCFGRVIMLLRIKIMALFCSTEDLKLQGTWSQLVVNKRQLMLKFVVVNFKIVSKLKFVGYWLKIISSSEAYINDTMNLFCVMVQIPPFMLFIYIYYNRLIYLYIICITNRCYTSFNINE